MPVLFKDCSYGPIELGEEMTGKEQQVLCELTKGILVKIEDEELGIFTVLRLTSDNGLILKGRYGRANAVETVEYIAKGVSKKIRNCNPTLLSTGEFLLFCQDNNLVADYFLEAPRNAIEYVVSTDKDGALEKLSTVLSLHDKKVNRRIKIDPGGKEYSIHNIGIVIVGRDLECFLKESKEKTINHLCTFEENPHKMHVEIRGII